MRYVYIAESPSHRILFCSSDSVCLPTVVHETNAHEKRKTRNYWMRRWQSMHSRCGKPANVERGHFISFVGAKHLGGMVRQLRRSNGRTEERQRVWTDRNRWCTNITWSKILPHDKHESKIIIAPSYSYVCECERAVPIGLLPPPQLFVRLACHSFEKLTPACAACHSIYKYCNRLCFTTPHRKNNHTAQQFIWSFNWFFANTQIFHSAVFPSSLFRCFVQQLIGFCCSFRCCMAQHLRNQNFVWWCASLFDTFSLKWNDLRKFATTWTPNWK